jgi:hypothetical protein
VIRARLLGLPVDNMRRRCSKLERRINLGAVSAVRLERRFSIAVEALDVNTPGQVIVLAFDACVAGRCVDR